MADDDTTSSERHREFRLLLGVIGALIVIGLAVVLLVVVSYRTGPIGGHPTSPTPTVTLSP